VDVGEASANRDETSRTQDLMNKKWLLIAGSNRHSIVRTGSFNDKHVPLLSKPPFFAHDGFFARREGLSNSFLRKERKLRRHSFSDTNLVLKMTELDQLRNLEVCLQKSAMPTIFRC
jgi:hypothetical protein